jgi:hypothetical protein
MLVRLSEHGDSIRTLRTTSTMKVKSGYIHIDETARLTPKSSDLRALPYVKASHKVAGAFTLLKGTRVELIEEVQC